MASLRDFGREAANNVLRRTGDAVLDEMARRRLVPCVMAEEDREGVVPLALACVDSPLQSKRVFAHTRG